ncbi:hypothetical protein GCM10018953_21050 [Streptosporangium nondiastaticum]
MPRSSSSPRAPSASVSGLIDRRLRSPSVLMVSGSFRCVRRSSVTVRVESVGRTSRYGSGARTAHGISSTAWAVSGWTGNSTCVPASSPGSPTAGNSGAHGRAAPVTRSRGTAAQRSSKTGANSGAYATSSSSVSPVRQRAVGYTGWSTKAASAS